MEIRRATWEDMDRIMEIYRIAQDFMIRTGNPTQWGHFYPQKEHLERDIREQASFVLYDEEGIHAHAYMSGGDEPFYRVIEDGAWPNDEPYYTIHRLASDGTRKGVFRKVMEFCREQCDHIRMDTHRDNAVMRHLAESEGFVPCGIIYVSDGTPRIAYQWDKK